MITTWRIVRIFISSTFRDMHAGRYRLVRVVFPQLKEGKSRRNLYLVDKDQPRVVTEEEKEYEKALDIILDECGQGIMQDSGTCINIVCLLVIHMKIANW